MTTFLYVCVWCGCRSTTSPQVVQVIWCVITMFCHQPRTHQCSASHWIISCWCHPPQQLSTSAPTTSSHWCVPHTLYWNWAALSLAISSHESVASPITSQLARTGQSDRNGRDKQPTAFLTLSITITSTHITATHLTSHTITVTHHHLILWLWNTISVTVANKYTLHPILFTCYCFCIVLSSQSTVTWLEWSLFWFPSPPQPLPDPFYVLWRWTRFVVTSLTQTQPLTTSSLTTCTSTDIYWRRSQDQDMPCRKRFSHSSK